MARASRASRNKSKSSVRVDLSNISKAFEPNQEYAIRCVEASLEEGQKAPYFNLKLQGIEGGDYENSVMYHRASTGEASLWRLRPLLEAFGFDIPDGPLDLDATDFVDREAMCSTFLDRYDGGSSVKPDEFWPLDGEGAGEKDEAPDAAEFDLDDLSDEEIEALAEELEVKGKTVAAKRKALAKLDQDDVAEAYEGLEKDDGAGEGGEEFDLDSLDDDDIMKLAKAAEVTAKTAKRAKAALEKMDQEDLAEIWAELSDGGDNDEPVTEDAVQDMNEEELEAVVERFELDVDLSTLKTLRKMKNAVIDAMEEGGHFD